MEYGIYVKSAIWSAFVALWAT